MAPRVRARALRRPCVPRRWRQCSGRAFARAKGCAFVTTKARRDGGDDDIDGGCTMCVAFVIRHSSFVLRHSFARVANVIGVVVNVPNQPWGCLVKRQVDDEDGFFDFLRALAGAERLDSQ
jgi:hypothetical protein